jgi:hypothetical protein
MDDDDDDVTPSERFKSNKELVKQRILLVDTLLSILFKCILFQTFLWLCNAKCSFGGADTVFICLMGSITVHFLRAPFVLICLVTSPLYLLDWQVKWITWPYPTLLAIMGSFLVSAVQLSHQFVRTYHKQA